MMPNVNSSPGRALCAFPNCIVAFIAGVLILVMPRLLNLVVSIYLIIVGLMGLYGGNTPPIVGAMRKFRVGWRPNALHPIAERHFGAELVEFSRHLGAIASVIA